MQAKNIEELSPVSIPDFNKWVKHGNFWFEEAPILPITLEVIMRNMVSVHKLFPPGLKFACFVYEGEYAHQVLSITESVETAKTQFREVTENPKKIKDFFQQWQSTINKLTLVLEATDKIDIEKIPNKELLKYFFSINSVFGDFCLPSIAIEPCKPFIDSYYFPNFEKTIEDKKTKEYFSILTLPSKHSFITNEKKDLLRMAIKYLNSEEKRKSFLQKSPRQILKEIRKKQQGFFSDLQFHTKKYFWMQNNYFDWTVLKEQDFLGFLLDTIKNKTIIELKRELAELENTNSLIEKQNRLLKELNLPEKILKEIEYIREITWLMDERKRMVLMFLHRMFRFLREIEKRTGLEEKLSGYALLNEIPLLLENNFSHNILKERRKLCIMITQKENKQSFFSGKDAKKFLNPLLSKPVQDASSGILGNVACRGMEAVVRGKAKVVLNSKGESISENEILVTTMTRPDFLSLMKKAKAIVTNEGGITCHAAIVSREMNKACIIATKHATDILKTGDEIELRMNHGWVRIIKRADRNE